MIGLPEVLDIKLQEASTELGVTEAEIVRNVLKQYLRTYISVEKIEDTK